MISSIVNSYIYIVTMLVSWVIAQSIKVILVLIWDKKVDFSRFVGSGGMPSSHAAFSVSLATIAGLKLGFDSIYFSICLAFALVVMYDASGIRRAAGNQAKILNQIIEHWDDDNDHPEIRDERLKELLGHTPYEVFAGAILGIAIAIFMSYVF